MFLSVIFITHNDRIESVKRLIRSITAYRDEKWIEFICIDNGSIPSSTSYIQLMHTFITVVRNGENIGTSRAYNHGLRFARGKYVLRINDDSVIPDTMLDMLYTFLLKNTNIDGLALGLKRDTDHYQAPRFKILNIRKRHPQRRVRATFIGTGNLLIKKGNNRKSRPL